ncbi:hypothetical protein FOL46_009313 [Perkinsus olseni]|uniref:Uncharacterized protein n=1 Tax=Perkinsus olseni TaxID=32597 RepID=A0A7J6L1B5_PEROL|nr:hypothetical protein FOL46_009313 [Perkinsus olseni]
MLPSTSRILSTVPRSLGPALATTATKESPPKTEEASTDKPPKRPWTATSLFLYGSGVAAASWVGYCAFQSGGNPHKTEIMIENSLKQLPLYKPPERPEAEKLSRVDQHDLGDATMKDLATWFMAEDKRAVDGVSRSMVLDFVGESLGLLEPEEAEMEKDDDKRYPRFGKGKGKQLSEVTKAFVHKGHGRLDEEKRQGGCSLSEAAEFLSSVIGIHGDDAADKVRQRLHVIVEKNYKNTGTAVSVFQNPMNITPPPQPLPEVDEEEANKAVLKLELGQYETELAEGDADKERKKWLQNEIKTVKGLLQKK